MKTIPTLGFGLGLRGKHHAQILAEKPAIDWFEIISENYMFTDGKIMRNLERIREHYPIAMHGVSMSIGTVDPLDSDYLKTLKKLIAWLEPAWVSDHLCWTGIAHKNTHDLLPVPYTEEALAHITARIEQVQDMLGRQLILENPSTYLEFKSSNIPEAEFLARMAEDADCGLLLDVNNVYVTCYNHGLDAKKYIDALPLHRVAQIHLSGHSNKGTHIIDTHDDHVIDEVWQLYRYVIHKAGLKNTMIEWDDNIPEFSVLSAELDKARDAAKTAQNYTPLPELARSNPAQISNKIIPLAHEQEKMQAAILSGEKTNPDWVRAKEHFAPTEQLQVYVNAYRWRLEDIVAEDFPVLAHVWGKEKLDAAIAEYVAMTPSHVADVAKYPAGFPNTIKEVFAHEIAILENAIAQIASLPETEALTPDHLAGMTPESLMEARLHPRAALKLFAFDYPVNDYYAAVMEEKNPQIPTPQESFLAVYRHEDAMWRLPLEVNEYALLQSLFNGEKIGIALEKAQCDENVLSGWFSRWIRNGLLSTQPANKRNAA